MTSADDPGYRLQDSALDNWNEKAMAKGGTGIETVAAVNRDIITTVRLYADKLISGAPNRVPGTVIWWTAIVDHDRRIVTIIDIEPEPRPGL